MPAYTPNRIAKTIINTIQPGTRNLRFGLPLGAGRADGITVVDKLFSDLSFYTALAQNVIYYSISGIINQVL
jgi:hypothetical protein